MRNGDDLYVEEHVSVPQAAMGCELSVETMEQPVTIKIPPGTQSGALLRLRDHGMPRLEARGQGDQFVKVIVDVPKKLNAKRRGTPARVRQNIGRKSGPV